jgi:hypothetical protein
MRINVKQPVLDYEGNPLLANKTNPDGSAVIGEDGRPVREPETLRSYLVTALNNKAASEHEPVPAEEAAKRYQLSVITVTSGAPRGRNATVYSMRPLPIAMTLPGVP